MTRVGHPEGEVGGGEELLREHELANRWKTSLRTLQRWRAEDFGPPFIRLGGSIRYRLSDVRAYEDRNRQSGAD